MVKINRKIWLSIAIWAFLYLFIFNMMNYYRPALEALAEASYEIFNLGFMYYITSLYLFPKFYTNNKKYLRISIATILCLALIFLLVDINFLPDFHPKEKERPPLFFIFFRYSMTLGFTYFVATSVSLMEHNNKLKEREKLLTQEKLATELKLLKAQINPHFIFNALNNIYSLTYMQNRNAPESVLKLSEMLRYVFYDCSKDSVHLSQEIKYIENFTAFQQMKSEFVQNIKMKSEVNKAELPIAPMLFIPFIENAFKYSRIEENEDAYVFISIKQKGAKLLFSIENSVPQNRHSSGSGMGIENVKHRLDIIYPNSYKLDINQNEQYYKVSLILDIKTIN